MDLKLHPPEDLKLLEFYLVLKKKKKNIIVCPWLQIKAQWILVEIYSMNFRFSSSQFNPQNSSPFTRTRSLSFTNTRGNHFGESYCYFTYSSFLIPIFHYLVFRVNRSRKIFLCSSWSASPFQVFKSYFLICSEHSSAAKGRKVFFHGAIDERKWEKKKIQRQRGKA